MAVPPPMGSPPLVGSPQPRGSPERMGSPQPAGSPEPIQGCWRFLRVGVDPGSICGRSGACAHRIHLSRWGLLSARRATAFRGVRWWDVFRKAGLALTSLGAAPTPTLHGYNFRWEPVKPIFTGARSKRQVTATWAKHGRNCSRSPPNLASIARNRPRSLQNLSTLPDIGRNRTELVDVVEFASKFAEVAQTWPKSHRKWQKPRAKRPNPSPKLTDVAHIGRVRDTKFGRAPVTAFAPTAPNNLIDRSTSVTAAPRRDNGVGHEGNLCP